MSFIQRWNPFISVSRYRHQHVICVAKLGNLHRQKRHGYWVDSDNDFDLRAHVPNVCLSLLEIRGMVSWRTEINAQWNSDFSNLQRRRKLLRQLGEFEKSGVNYNVWLRRGNKFWFELLGSSKNWGFEKSGFHSILKCFPYHAFSNNATSFYTPLTTTQPIALPFDPTKSSRSKTLFVNSPRRLIYLDQLQINS